jgi:hypothetical protein
VRTVWSSGGRVLFDLEAEAGEVDVHDPSRGSTRTTSILRVPAADVETLVAEAFRKLPPALLRKLRFAT